jgi:hypothetical protein
MRSRSKFSVKVPCFFDLEWDAKTSALEAADSAGKRHVGMAIGMLL